MEELDKIENNINATFLKIKKNKEGEKASIPNGILSLLLLVEIVIAIWAWGLYFTGVAEAWPIITELCNYSLLSLFITISIIVYGFIRNNNNIEEKIEEMYK